MKGISRRLYLMLLLPLSLLAAPAAPLSAKTPVIGISSYIDQGACRVNMNYVHAVRRAGGIPLVIPLTTDDSGIAAALEAVDGLLMTGGEDFDPLKWYGEEPVRALGKVTPDRDEYDVKMVRAAVARGIPVLGICRGAQLLAVAFGGSLWQDIPSQLPSSYVKHRQDPTDGTALTHSVTLEKGSVLAGILGREQAVVNSFHHQAVKQVPEGFRACAFAADGVIEALERSGRLGASFADGGGWILGVQFHPEAPVSAGSPEFLPIFQAFVREASR